MQRTNVPAHRSGPVLGAVLLAITAVLSFTPVVPQASAVNAPNPTTAPAANPAASVDPGLTATATPGPLPTPDPGATPVPTPDPGATPTPAPTDSPVPTDSPTPAPTDSPSPTPEPTLPPGAAGPAGGILHFADADLTIPADALAAPAQFDVQSTGGPDYAGLPPIRVFIVTATDLGTGQPLTTFGAPVTVTVNLAGTDLTGVETANLRVGRLDGGAWSPLPTGSAGDTLDADIDAPGVLGVIEQPMATAVTVTLDTDAPAVGRHRMDPGSTLHLDIVATPAAKLYRGELSVGIPDSWAITDASGGTYDAATGRLTWTIRNAAAGKPIDVTPVLQAPDASPLDGSLIFAVVFSARLDQANSAPATSKDASVLVAPRIAIEHSMLGTPGENGGTDVYLAQDATLKSAAVFDPFRVRFRLENPDSLAVTVRPQLEYRPLAMPNLPFRLVPDPASFGDSAFHAAAELSDGATRFVVIGPGSARIAGTRLTSLSFVAGYRSEGINPGNAVTLTGDSATEIEFSVSPTVFADYLGDYEFRLVDAGGAVPVGSDIPLATAIPFSTTTRVTIETEPQPELTGVQRQGQPMDGVQYQLLAPATDSLLGMTAAAPQARLAPLAVTLAGPGTAGPTTTSGPTTFGPTTSGPVHGDMSLTTDSCSACHRTHTAQAAQLFALAGPQSTVCFTCHNGTGAPTGPSHQYALALPNVPPTSSYYQHPATDPAALHSNANNDEFSFVLNRHSLCTDCHNPHTPRDATLVSTQTANGWTASGAETGASGVAVTNNAAGAAPTYRFLVANLAAGSLPISLEYQLCFKCHSGWTQLPARNASHPSWWALDKGVEFNTNNVSYHPVEAAGKNLSTQMGASLLGTSTYKLWNFTTTSTIRCTQCHADSGLLPVLLAGTPGTANRLDDHASANRGILLGNYRDRTLHLRSQAYAKLDFQLCYLCHAEAPLSTTSKDPRSDTLFPLHGFHVFDPDLRDKGSTTNADIDSPNAGGGNAICSECHYRIHSTVTKVGTQNVYQGLVNFAPNVTGQVATSWSRTQTGTTIRGSCTLTCHGHAHTAANSGYQATP